MANGKSNNARRRDVRRAVPRPAPKWLDALRQRDVGWAALFVLALAVIGSFIAVTSQNRTSYYLSQIIDQPIIARVEFEATDTETTERNREFAMREVPSVFVHNADLLNAIEERVLGLLDHAQRPYDQIDHDFLDSMSLTAEGHQLLQEFVQSPDASTDRRKLWASHTDKMLRSLFRNVILDTEEHAAVIDSPNRRIVTIHPRPYEGSGAETTYTKSVLIPIDNLELIETRLESEATTMAFPAKLRKTVLAVIMQQMTAPTYYLDEDTTAARQEAAAQATPLVSVTYRPDDVLINSGERLSADHLQLIADEQQAVYEQTPAHHFWLAWLGVVGLIALIGLGVWCYIFAYSPKIRRNPMRGLAMTAILLLCQTAAVFLVGLWPEISLGGVTFATLLGAVIFAIVYDQRFALMMGLAVAVLIVLSLRLPVTTAIVMLVGVGVAVAQLHEVRSRSKLVTVGLWSGLAMGLATGVAGLAERSFNLPSMWTVPFLNTQVSAQWGLLGSDVAYALLAGVAVGLLVQGVLPTIEKIFHITTAMTLKELNDASHPLLQRLAQESPGTYQHSLRIADMTEAAAESIGGDGLLCRVGAMYHDIGKINKPSYFIENQGGGPNKHDKLSPAMSLLIIVGHVKDGVEMAREYNLPPSIRHFIESHHGTTLVEFFYHAAKKQKEAEEKPAPSEFEFRYPGPKPQTKEAAIMLLCDGIEAAARSMDEPTAVRLEQLVHGIATKRLMDGQFDECNMTLGELSKVEAAITKTLCAVYHSRIKYPDGKGADAATADKASA